jgi:hypothetical protein
LLLKFVAPSLRDGLRSDGLEVPIMQNVLDAFHSVWCAECKKAAAEATANVHGGYRMACDVLERGDKRALSKGRRPHRGSPGARLRGAEKEPMTEQAQIILFPRTKDLRAFAGLGIKVDVARDRECWDAAGPRDA